MSDQDPTLEAWRASIAAATVTELLACDPAGACEAHGRCWAHSEWPRCNSLIRSVSSDPCAGVVDGLDGLCSGCREFKVMCEQHDDAVRTATCPWTTGGDAQGVGATVCGRETTYECKNATSDLCSVHKSSCCTPKPTPCAHCAQLPALHPVPCFGCQTCMFTCDHYICVEYVARDKESK